MGGMNLRDAYEFDPETCEGDDGALAGMMQRYMQQQGQRQQGVDFGATPSGAPNYSPETSVSPQGDLLSRLLSRQAE